MSKRPRIRTNLIYSAIYQFINMAIPFIVSPYVTRVLSTDGLGVYTKTEALARYFVLFSMLGVNNYGNRAIARCRDDKDTLCKTFWEIYSFQLLVSIILTCAYFFCFSVWDDKNKIIRLLQIIHVSSAIFDANWFCLGMENFKLVSVRNIFVKLMSAIMIFVAVNREEDLFVYTIIMSASFLMSALISWPYIIKTVHFVKPTVNGILRHIKPNVLLFFPVLATSVYNLMDRLMLGAFSLDREVTFYTYAETIVTLPTSLILALDNVIMPRMSNLFAKESEPTQEISKLMDRVMLVAMFFSTGMAFGIAAISKEFIPWYYGDAYVRCGFFALLLSPVIVFKGWAGALRTQYIIPSGNDKIYIISIVSGAVVNVILNLLLIPCLFGVGAIIGTIAAELSVFAIQFLACRKKINSTKYVLDGIGFIISGFVMFVLLRIMIDYQFSTIIIICLKIIIGALVYSCLGLLYLIVIRKDYNIIGLISRKFGQLK